MSQPSVLFIGGTGVISTACVREAMRQGRAVTLLNRGETTHRSEICSRVIWVICKILSYPIPDNSNT